MALNPVDNYPRVRKALYDVQWVVNGILALAGAYFAVDGVSLDDLPSWYLKTLALAPVLWTYLGLTAKANVEVPPEPPADGGGLPGYTPGRDDHNFTEPTEGTFHLADGDTVERLSFKDVPKGDYR